MSMDHESGESWKTVLLLAYQSLGVVFGQLSISPLYVYETTVAGDIEISKTNEEIFGVLSFVLWTLTLVPLLKYVFIVLRADDNGEGGTFALYSLLCRHAKIGSMPDFQVADEELLAYKKDQNLPPNSNKGLWLKSTLEKSKVLQKMLLVLALIGACMVIGDGVLTPSISVVSAVSGLQLGSTGRDIQLSVTCIILVCLFSLQHYGTHRVGFLFAPIVLTWLVCIAAIGLFNILSINPQVYRALCPLYMFRFLKKSQKRGWLSLGGILLCITGSEAMFAGLGHFSQLSMKIAFTFLVYPSLTLAYMGQAAYLSKNHGTEFDYSIKYHMQVPEQLRIPVSLISLLAAVVGSQTIITGTFSIIKQCLALGCFPRVKVVHTSFKRRGQIYIPEINWILMLLCLAVTIGFQDVRHLGNASGLAVITVMLVTTCLMSLVIVLCWHQNIFLAICFILFFGSIETLYFSASLIKIREGAWFPVALSFVITAVMYVWHYGSTKKYEFDVQNKISVDWILSLDPSLGLVRVPGIGVVHTELVSGIPLIFAHFVTNIPAFHQVVVFLCTKSVPVPYVQPEERFLIGRIGPSEHRIYRCIARYGYQDIREDDLEFERYLVFSVAEFIRTESLKPNEKEEHEKMIVVGINSNRSEDVQLLEEGKDPADAKGSPLQIGIQPPGGQRKRVRFMLPESAEIDKDVNQELQELTEARESGMTFILGHSYVRAKHQSSLMKRLAVNVGYDFLRRNSRSSVSNTPQISTLEVGMVYHV